MPNAFDRPRQPSVTGLLVALQVRLDGIRPRQDNLGLTGTETDMKAELMRLVIDLQDQLASIKKHGYSDERLAAALSVAAALQSKLDEGSAPSDIDVAELVDDGSVDGD